MFDQRSASRGRSKRPLRVLIVEDEAVIAMDLEGLLTKMGYEPVGIVSRSQEVVPTVQRVKPELVLMDVRLGSGYDGIALAEEIYVCERVPVVFVTAFSDAKTIERMRTCGSYGCVVKPVDEGTLNATISIAMGKHQEVLANAAAVTRPSRRRRVESN